MARFLKEKKFFILILAVLVLVAIILSLFLFNKDNKTTEDREKHPSSEEPQEEKKEDDEDKEKEITRKEKEKIYEEASSTGDVELCQQIPDDLSSDICIKNIAIENRDKDDCQYIKDKEEEEDCVNKIIFREIKESEDIEDMEICLDMSTKTYTRRCISSLAEEQGDKVDPEACEVFEGEIKDFCVENTSFRAAVSGNNLSDCKDLETEQRKMECIVTIADSAGIKVDRRGCEEFEDSDIRDYCKKVVSQ